MKFTASLTPLLALFVSSGAFAQQARVEGRVFDERESTVPNLSVSSPGGQRATTDSGGHFTIDYSSSVQPGQATRLQITKPNWVIFQPMFGNCVTQSVQNYQPLKVIIVPRGSPLALSPRRISQVVAKLASERDKLRKEVRSLGDEVGSLNHQIDDYAFLRKYSDEYGFSLDTFKAAAQQWAQIKDSDNDEERARKEYWLSNYKEAAQLALAAGKDAEREFAQADKERTAAAEKLIGRFMLAGSGFYHDYDFKHALETYSTLRQYFETGKFSKEDWSVEWDELRLVVANTKMELGLRVQGSDSLDLLKGAIADYQEFVTHFRAHDPQVWAIAQNNLGGALLALSDRLSGAERDRYLNEALSAFHSALEVTNKEQSPSDWAATQNNLGNALDLLSERENNAERVKYSTAAVEAFRASLQVVTREHFPKDWAIAQGNLANAMVNLGEGLKGAEAVRNLVDAVAIQRETLQILTRAKLPEEWARTQSNLGFTLGSLAGFVSAKERMDYSRQAVASFRAALEVRTLERLPQPWANTQSGLGKALASLGEQESGTERLNDLNLAIGAFRAALKVFTREDFPQEWAKTQYDFGEAVLSFGNGARNYEDLKDAVAGFRASLEPDIRAQFPRHWAKAQNNLGVALSRLSSGASQADGVRELRDALVAFRAALEVRVRDQEPMDWATTQMNIGETSFTLSERLGDAENGENLKDAVVAFRAALEVKTREQSTEEWGRTQNNLGGALERLSERATGDEKVKYLNDAIAALRAALQAFTRDQFPEDWANTQNNLGYVLETLAENGTESIKNFTDALISYRASLEVLKREGSPKDWATTHSNIASALLKLGLLLSDAERTQQVNDAIASDRAALEVFKREQFPQDWADTQKHLGRSYSAIKDWQSASEAYANVLDLYPGDEGAYFRLRGLYHNAMFQFDKGYTLNQKWLVQHQGNVMAQAYFAENSFTTGRLAECSEHISGLLNNPDVPVRTKTALRVIEIANLLADKKDDLVAAQLDALIADVSLQPKQFNVDWAFSGTKHFIDQYATLESHRAWLGELFDALASQDRDTMLTALRHARKSLSN